MASFFPKGVELVQQAIKKDEAKQFDSALPLYTRAIEYFLTGLKCINYNISLQYASYIPLTDSKNQRTNDLVRHKGE